MGNHCAETGYRVHAASLYISPTSWIEFLESMPTHNV